MSAGAGAKASELSLEDQPLAIARLALSSKTISDPSVYRSRTGSLSLVRPQRNHIERMADVDSG